MTKNSRLKAPSLSSRIEFDRCVDDLARTTVALRKLEARRDEKIQAVRAEWEPGVREAGARVEALTLLVEKYAEEHRDELLPGKAKSAETALAFFGFRLGQPTLKLLNRSWTWEKVVEVLDARHLLTFIRMRREPDKDALKQQLDAEQLAAVGCRVDQAETFFVEPKEQSSTEAKAS
ncbi:host-nuclease inhibitor Gam family protein [Horticoccus luteus]|uniref:Host-nuclease inhibitor Gam family protein n=1 Tax=Horticoccus luteus TaxID=2862869 RepID=A0A8F9TY37_9BACT|nr:host-nuclease inhibitor Gam family protein [Horticoccus luteus]QYM80255.1 host-nuclease inhibitor Gam family protein [Horticoccus luteus]